MCLLTLATTTRDGRPITGAIDGFFYRGAFRFGSAPHSLLFRHIAERPHVSATHLPGEQLGVTVHGLAHEIDLSLQKHAGFRATGVEIYGEEWNDWGVDTPEPGAAYARIDATHIFTFHLDPEEPASKDSLRPQRSIRGLKMPSCLLPARQALRSGRSAWATSRPPRTDLAAQ